jgi:glycerophosphoryl diester phosphodiesterase
LPELPPALLLPPIAHRGLHGQGRPENSPAAFAASFDYGYGIELDVQLSSDGEAMVFHDYELGRLTDAQGAVRQQSAAALGAVALANGEGIPTLEAVLKLVSGQVGVLVEIKDQDGALGDDLGPLETRVAEVLNAYRGPVAVMSLNPHAIYLMQDMAPNVPRGLVTSPFSKEHWPQVSRARADELAEIPDFEACGASFISHQFQALDMPAVNRIRQQGDPVLSWTIKSEDDEHEARRLADNITFEGYLP